MGRRSYTALEEIVRTNVRGLLKEKYDGKPGKLKTRNPHVTLSRLQDFVEGRSGCNLSSLQPWADALGVKPFHLLVPDLDHKEPQELVPAKQLRAVRQLKQQLLEGDQHEVDGKGKKGG